MPVQNNIFDSGFNNMLFKSALNENNAVRHTHTHTQTHIVK
jgi:hypothetical protein